MLADTAPASWQAYLRFHTVDKASPYLGDAFVQENYNFYGKALRGQQEIKPRWKRVLDTIDNGAGEAMGQMYVDVAFSPESKARMETLVENLGAALKNRSENLDGASNQQNKHALEVTTTEKERKADNK